ncbi:MAG TPA: ABC transporter permease [Erysipelothrix sp.]|nr:ABC transporter permease [Erysipelothrix sp.]
MESYRRLVYPYLVWMGIFIGLPMFLIVMYAFTTPGNETVSFVFTLENFKRFFDPIFVNVLLRSLTVAGITTILCLIIGYPMAYMISRLSPRFQVLMMLFVTIPMWINTLIRTYSWISLLSDNGIINTFLVKLGIGPFKMMYTDFSVILGMVYTFLPFMILSIYSQLAKMDHSLLEAAADLGASKLKSFLKVTFPLSIPGVVSGITLVFLPSVSSFIVPQLLGGGSYMLIGNLIEKQFIVTAEWNFGSAISLLMTLVIFISMALIRYFDKDIEEVDSKVARRNQYGRI